MAEGGTFIRRHDIKIDAPAAAIYDYVTNPNSWPEWIAASHEIDSPDRPLKAGDTFNEAWKTRKGGSELNWTVVVSEHPRLWIAETQVTFIGKITARYDVDQVGDQQRFTRTIINEDRPNLPTDAQIARVDQEAAIALANIKTNVEARRTAQA